MRSLRVIAQIALVISAYGATVPLSYDRSYDNAGESLTKVACSDGSHGLMTRGFDTFGSLPKFPFIGGAEAIEGWNSANCGSCYQLTYTNVTSGSRKSINVLAIDRAHPGFNIALRAMEELVGPHASKIGIVEVDSKRVSSSVCGLR